MLVVGPDVELVPVAGTDGTLKSRMIGTAATGNVREKTGTLRFVNTLSGYAVTAAGERLAFSIMLNNYHNEEKNRSARDLFPTWIRPMTGASVTR